MRALFASLQQALVTALSLIGLVYLVCLGGVLAARLSRRGHPAYLLAVLGALCFLIGVLWGRGYLSSGATFTFLGAGVVLAVFGVALDLIFGPTVSPSRAE